MIYLTTPGPTARPPQDAQRYYQIAPLVRLLRHNRFVVPRGGPIFMWDEAMRTMGRPVWH